MAEKQKYNFNYYDNLKPDDIKKLKIQLLFKDDPDMRDKKLVSDEELKGYEMYRYVKDTRPSDSSEKTPLSAVPLTALQGFTLGFGDEILGATSGTGQFLYDKLRGRDANLGESISKATDYYRKPVDIMRKNYPKLSALNELAGGVASGIGLAKAIPGAVSNTLAGRLLTGRGGSDVTGRAFRQIIPGALLGGAYGYGVGEGGVDNRVDTAQSMAKMGAIAGPAFSVGGEALMGTFRGLSNQFTPRGTESKPVRDVLNPIVEKLGGKEKVTSEIESGKPIILQGEGETIGDVGASIKPFVKPEQEAENILKDFLGDPKNEMTKAYSDVLDTLKDESIDVSYRGSHQPRTVQEEGAIRLDNLTRDLQGNKAGYDDYFYTPEGKRVFAPGKQFKDDEYGMANDESYNAILKAKDNPDAEITIYRAVPDDVDINTINDGDFVTLSPKYAKMHRADGYGMDYSGDKPVEIGQKVISQKVKVRDIIWDGNDVNEFAYSPVDETFSAYADRITGNMVSAAERSYEAQKLNEFVPDKIYNNIVDIAKDTRFKNFGKKIIKDIEVIRGGSKLDDVFRLEKDGSITVVADKLTVSNVEDFRRAIGLMDKDLGPAVVGVKSDIEKEVRKILDDNFVKLKDARFVRAKAFKMQDIYENATKLYKTGKEQDFIDYFNQMMQQKNRGNLSEGEVLNTFRRAALKNIYDLAPKKATTSRVDYIRQLSDPKTAAYKMLSKIYPEKNFEKLVNDAFDMDLRFQAKSKFEYGSNTQMNIDRTRFRTQLGDISGIFKIIDRVLSGQKALPADKRRIAEIVISKNPTTLKFLDDPRYQTFFEQQIANEITNVLGVTAQDNLLDTRVRERM